MLHSVRHIIEIDDNLRVPSTDGGYKSIDILQGDTEATSGQREIFVWYDLNLLKLLNGTKEVK
jgi:hypothetical protein